MRSKGSQPHTGLLSPCYQCLEEESPQHLDMKINRDFVEVMGE